MNYEILAIPTVYAGAQFRSRLEARWAAFFDLLGWQWDYEPITLKGWMPDFVIHGIRPIYVEVKPIWTTKEAEPVADKIDAAYPPCKGEALICGAGPLRAEVGRDQRALSLGWLGLSMPTIVREKWVSGSRWWTSALFATWSGKSRPSVGFCGYTGLEVDRLTGAYSGTKFVLYGERNVFGFGGNSSKKTRWDSDVLDKWNEAGTIVRWKGPNGCNDE